jgi:hypothetical protein
MKRRDFLTLLTTAGAGAALTTCTVDRPHAKLLSSDLAGGSFTLSHRRQGVGYPVTVQLELPNAEGLTFAPRPLIVREEAQGWHELIGQAGSMTAKGDRAWTWEWTPSAVRPSDAETTTEVVRYRFALLDSDEGRPALLSESLEVVCAYRGWGC